MQGVPYNGIFQHRITLCADGKAQTHQNAPNLIGKLQGNILTTAAAGQIPDPVYQGNNIAGTEHNVGNTQPEGSIQNIVVLLPCGGQNGRTDPCIFCRLQKAQAINAGQHQIQNQHIRLKSVQQFQGGYSVTAEPQVKAALPNPPGIDSFLSGVCKFSRLNSYVFLLSS